MKKFKLMFTAAAVFAVVGTALAFNAPKTNGNLYCKTGAAGTCPTATKYIQDDENGTQMRCRLITGTGNCATLTNVVVDN